MSLWFITKSNGSQVINGVLAHVHLTMGPLGPQDHPVVIFLGPECRIGIDSLSNCQNPHIGSHTRGLTAAVVGKVMWEPLELPLLGINGKPKAISHLWKHFRN